MAILTTAGQALSLEKLHLHYIEKAPRQLDTMQKASFSPLAAQAESPQIVAVAAAVLLREGESGTEFLLAQRPEGKVYAGYWELHERRFYCDLSDFAQLYKPF